MRKYIVRSWQFFFAVTKTVFYRYRIHLRSLIRLIQSLTNVYIVTSHVKAPKIVVWRSSTCWLNVRTVTWPSVCDRDTSCRCVHGVRSEYCPRLAERRSIFHHSTSAQLPARLLAASGPRFRHDRHALHPRLSSGIRILFLSLIHSFSLSPVYSDTTQLNSTLLDVELSWVELRRFGHPLRRTTPIADGRWAARSQSVL